MITLLGALLIPLSAAGQDEDDIEAEFDFLEEELDSDEIKSASKHRQSIFWSPSSITVITREDIRSSGAVMIADTLRRVAGIDVMDMKYAAPVVGARALTDESSNLMLVLIDGREAGLEFNGMTMWAGLSTDLEEIERIEVIRGPGSSLYGANAFSGVVNIVTVTDKSVSRNQVNLNMGERGYLRLNGILREYWMLGEGELSVQFMIGNQAKRSSTDHRTRNYVPTRTHAVVRYRQGKSLDLSLQGGYLIGQGVWYSHVGDLVFHDATEIWAMLKAGTSLGEIAQLRAQVYYTHYSGEFTARTNLSAFGVWIANFPTFHPTFPVADGQLQLDLRLAENLLLMTGANLRYLWVDCPQFDPPNFEELRASGFVQAQWTIADQLQLTGGLRFDYSDLFDAALSPRFVAVYRPSETQAFRAGYGLAFRKPSLYESHAHLMSESHNPATPEVVDKLLSSFGNEDLTNEEVHSFEAGWRAGLLDDMLRMSLGLFFNIYQNTIYFRSELKQGALGAPNIRDSIIRYENEDRNIHALGGELELVFRGGENWQVWSNLGLRRVTWANDGKLIPSEPVLRVNLGGRYEIQGVILDLALHHVSAYSYPLADPKALLNEREDREVGDHFMLVGRLGYGLELGHKRHLEAGLTVRTPLGVKGFREYPGMVMPQTNMRINQSDWGGEFLMRLLDFYLRAVF